jgi:RNA polymerase sigma-70 factor, ECF subfamily
VSTAEPARDTRGSAPDLASIYEAEVAYVWESLRRLGVRDADLEDVAHDLFLAVRRRLPDYDPGRPLRPWLFGFAYRLASDYRRSARVRLEVVALPVDAADGRADAEEQLAAREARDLILGALAGVPLEQRAVFVMHDLDGCSIPEIADALGAPENTLYSRLRAARTQFTAAVRRVRVGEVP